MSKRLWITVVVVATLGLAACGGSVFTAKTTPVKHRTTKTKTTPGGSATTVSALTLTVRAVTGPAATYGSSITASKGQAVQFRAMVPGSGPKATAHPVKVSLQVAHGPSSKLVVTATSGGQSSKVTVHSAGHAPVTLEGLHYTCSLPPAPTYCPPVRTSGGTKGYVVEFATTHITPILVSATVGPVAATKPLLAATTKAVVPAYTVSETARTVQVGSTKTPAKPTTSVSARPGDLVAMITRLSGKIRGAPQTVTITLDQGPANSLSVSSSVPGGKTSTATIKSASGSKISLVLPRYTCFVAPTPTFCPASTVRVLSRRYTITFSASPSTAPIVLLATVEAG